MKLTFSKSAWNEYVHWQQTDKAITRKINSLIKECLRHPFEGSGKPEPLKGDLSGFWSRRINREHRLVYRLIKDGIEIAQCRYHY